MRGSLNFAFEDCKTIDQNFYQEALDVEQKVKELQVRVGDLMIVILNCVRLKDEDGSEETVVKEQDIEELRRCALRMWSFTVSDHITGFLGQSMRI